MTVLIKGMELPKDCGDCPCSRYEHALHCMVTMEDVYPFEKPDWCPMYEVEEAYFSHRPQQNVYAKLP